MPTQKAKEKREKISVKAEKPTIQLLLATFYEAPKEEKNLPRFDMIDASEVREDDENYKNPIDHLFDALERKDPIHFALSNIENIN